MIRSIYIVFLVVALAGAAQAAGALKFAAPEMNIGILNGDAPTTIIFEFRNEGGKAVRVLKSQTGCDCTTIEDKVLSYEPGAAGKISVDFNPQGLHGLQKKTVVVMTDEVSDPVYYLSFAAEIRQLFSVSSRIVTWDNANDCSPRKVMLDADRLDGARVKSVECDQSLATTSYREVSPGKRFEITITPVGLTIAAPARITINLEGSSVPAQVVTLMARRR
jgi:hypothetical protein